MANPSDSSVQNLLPVQAYFDVDGNFQTFIGQGQPFYATPDPSQSGLHITNSTIDSSPIGATTPSTGAFTSGTVLASPTAATDIANKQYVDYYAAGLSWKEPCLVASTANITALSGLLTIDTVTVAAGNRVLVKNQGTASQNGIYTVSAGPWTRSVGADDWNEFLGAITFIVEGSQGGSAWYCTAQPGGTLGVTDLNWSNFSVSSSYTAGTGLTLSGSQFSITNTGVVAGTYGNDARTVTLAINAQGQITSAVDQPISIAGSQITSGTIGSSYLSGSYANITGVGTLGGLTVTNPIVGSITGSAASATTATTATNIAGGAAGSVFYQSAAGATALLAAGSNGQVLTLASGVPSWVTPAATGVTSVSGAGTVNGLTLTGTVTSTGSLTLGGTLDLSSPPAIGGTAANTINGTTITASTAVKSPYFDATTSAGGALRNASGTAQLQWGGGGGNNLTVDVSANLNGTNAQIDISPTGTGHVHINPTGSGSVQIAPTSAGTMDNLAIGGTTPLAGTFTTLRVNSTISLAGSTGTAGYALISNGASAPTWQAISAGLTVTDDTSTNATRYLTFTSATSGSITGINTGSTKLSFNPSTGSLSATKFIGDGSSLTGISSGASWQSVQTSSFTAVAGNAYAVNTTSGAVTVTLPASPTAGQFIIITDYARTFGTNACTLAPNGNKISGSTSNAILNTNGESANIVYIDSTQGWIAYAGLITSPIASYTATYLVVAGGGAGAQASGSTNGCGGGGGAGGLLTTTTLLVPGTSYTVTVGAGGAAVTGSGSVNGAGNNGSNSSISGVATAIGGGGGGAGSANPAGNGGSGGGNYAGYNGSGTSGQGYAGGGSAVGSNAIGGGGGASAVGQDGSGTLSGNGGAGTASSISGSSVTYAGGGGGGGSFSVSPSISGGAGGGGAGGGYRATGTSGTANTGGGGGASGAGDGQAVTSGAGGSGIVIISYAGSQRGTGGTVTSAGGNTVHTFTTSGTYTA